MFFLRGVLVQAGHSARALSVPLRYASYSIDSALLIAALLLLTMLPAAAYANGWLLAKLLLLPIYVALGWMALHKAQVPRTRFCFLAGAVLTYVFMLSIARAHHPLGLLRWWIGN